MPTAGSMVGKALYEGMLINVQFAHFFITRIQASVLLLVLG